MKGVVMGNETYNHAMTDLQRPRVLTLAEAMSTQAERQTTPIVDGLIEAGDLIVLAGEPKDGKSVLIANLSATIAAGGSWLGMRVRQGKVVWLAYEENLREWLNNFRTYPGIETEVLIVPEPPVIDTPKGIAEIEWLLDVYRPTLLVIDPLVAATEDPEFDRQGLTRAKLQPLKRLLMKRECAAVVIHHLTKGTGRGSASHDRISGSKQIEAAGSGAWVMTVKVRKDLRMIDLHIRHRGPANGTVLHIDSPTIGTFKRVPKRARATQEANASARILTFIKSTGSSTQKTLRGELRLSQGAVSKACTALVKDGLLTERPGSRPSEYSLATPLTQEVGTTLALQESGSPATRDLEPLPST